MSSKKAIIIGVGDELLIGQTIDTNSAFIAKAIAPYGFDVIRKYVISDTEEEIKKSLDLAIPDADLVILTGGLGPTKDDITKYTLNTYFAGELITNETVLQHVRQFFEKRNRPMLQTNEAQALVPNNCEILFNRLGTAPGMLFKRGTCTVISLPGVPSETQTIIQEELLPRLAAERNGLNNTSHRHLVTFGIGESFLAEKIKDIESALPSSIKLAYLPEHNLMKLRLTLTPTTQPTTDEIGELNTYTSLIQERISEFVIGADDSSLETLLVSLLKNNRLTVATAESCTGGAIASSIADVPGASEVLIGGIVCYANRIKTQELGVSEKILNEIGAVSHETVSQMAKGCRAKMGSDIAVSVSGILGPTGATDIKPVGLVYFGIDSRLGTQTFEFKYHYGRDVNKTMAIRQALFLVLKEGSLLI